MQENQFKFGEGVSDGKLVVVGHSAFFKVLTARQEYWDTEFKDRKSKFYNMLPDRKYCAVMDNVEAYPFVIDS